MAGRGVAAELLPHVAPVPAGPDAVLMMDSNYDSAPLHKGVADPPGVKVILYNARLKAQEAQEQQRLTAVA